MTEYIQKDRRREVFAAFGRRVWITRCDLNQQFLLNLDGREYSVAMLSTFPEVLQMRKQWPTRGKGSGTGTVLLEITTEDTGERQHRFGFMARRVVVTSKEIPRPGARSVPAEVRSVGWYLGFKPQTSCEGRFGGSGSSHVAWGRRRRAFQSRSSEPIAASSKVSTERLSKTAFSGRCE